MNAIKFLKMVCMTGLMASFTWMDSNAVTVLQPTVDMVEEVTQKVLRKSAYQLGELLPPDTPPEYRGGVSACKQFLAKNMKYPQEASYKNIQGKVVVELMLDEKGKITEVRILRSLHPILDEEAIRVCKMMPKFKPAKLQGKAIPSAFVMPIGFYLR